MSGCRWDYKCSDWLAIYGDIITVFLMTNDLVLYNATYQYGKYV